MPLYWEGPAAPRRNSQDTRADAQARKFNGRFLVSRPPHRGQFQGSETALTSSPFNSLDENGEPIGDVFRVPMHPNTPFQSFELVIHEVIAAAEELFNAQEF